MRTFLKAMALTAVLALTAGAAGAEDFVILDSNAAGIEPGLVVDGTADITIPEGATVVLIDPAGDTLGGEGPFTGRLVAAASSGEESLRDALGRLTTTRGEDTKVLGAVRSPAIEGGSVTE